MEAVFSDTTYWW